MEGNPLTSAKDDNAIILLPEEQNMETGLPKQAKEKYPELVETEAEQGLASIIQTTTGRVGGESKSWEKHIYKVNATGEAENDIFLALNKLRKGMTDSKREKVSIPSIRGVDTQKLRKMAEIAFVDSEATVFIHVPLKLRTTQESEQSE